MIVWNREGTSDASGKEEESDSKPITPIGTLLDLLLLAP